MDDISLLEEFPHGDASLHVVNTNGQTYSIRNLDLSVIQTISPVLAHAFENSAHGPSHSVEDVSFSAVASLLRHVYTYDYVPESLLDTPTSILLHVEVYCLATVYDIPALITNAKGRVSYELMLATSSPEPPQDLCEALAFVYQRLPSDKDLILTLAYYCITCCLTHKLNEDDSFITFHHDCHQFQQDLCTLLRTNAFADETASAIIQLSAKPSGFDIADPLNDVDVDSEEKIQLRMDVSVLEAQVKNLQRQLQASQEETARFARSLEEMTANRNVYLEKFQAVAQRDRMTYWDKQHLRDTVESQRDVIQELQSLLEAAGGAGLIEEPHSGEPPLHSAFCYERSPIEVQDMLNTLPTQYPAATVSAPVPITSAHLQDLHASQRLRSLTDSDSDYDMVSTPPESRTMSPEVVEDIHPTSRGLAQSSARENTHPEHVRDGEVYSDEEWGVIGPAFPSIPGKSAVDDRTTTSIPSRPKPRKRSIECTFDTPEAEQAEKSVKSGKCVKTSAISEIEPMRTADAMTEEAHATEEQVEFLDDFVQSLHDAQVVLLQEVLHARFADHEHERSIGALEDEIAKLKINVRNLKGTLAIQRDRASKVENELKDKATKTETHLNEKIKQSENLSRVLQDKLDKSRLLSDCLQIQTEALRADLDQDRQVEANNSGAIKRLRRLLNQHRNAGKSAEQVDWDDHWESTQLYRSQAEELEHLADTTEHINAFIDGLLKTQGATRKELDATLARETAMIADLERLQHRNAPATESFSAVEPEADHIESVEIWRRRSAGTNAEWSRSAIEY